MREREILFCSQPANIPDQGVTGPGGLTGSPEGGKFAYAIGARRTTTRAHWRLEETRKEGRARRQSCGGGGEGRRREGGREVSHEFTAWLNIVNYWLAALSARDGRTLGKSGSQDGHGHGQALSRLFHPIPFRLITRGI